jgi:Restriction endonuclease BamHI
MKLMQYHWLSDEKRALADSDIAQPIRDIATAIGAIVWPPGSQKFTIYPESGKKRGEGNGVRPIRDAFVLAIGGIPGWRIEFPIAMNPTDSKTGPIDGVFATRSGLVAVEWETGNVSSSHRSLNKIVYALQSEAIRAGFLIAPSRRLYRYLTDRVGNVPELMGYFGFWRRGIPPDRYCAVIEVEFDDTSTSVPRISKGTDGRALV